MYKVMDRKSQYCYINDFNSKIMKTNLPVETLALVLQ